MELVAVVQFQSPSGVLGVCRIITAERGHHGLPRLVSVPFRGFRGLQAALGRPVQEAQPSEFQSPSGVLGVCR